MASAMSIGTVYGLFEVRERVTQTMPPVVRELQRAKDSMGALARESVTAATGLDRIPGGARQAGAALNTMSGAAGGLSKALGSVAGLLAGAFTLTALTQAASAVIELGGELTDLEAKTGIGVEALQEFKYAAGQVGVSLEAITGAVGQMQNRLAEGDKSAVSALKTLGLSLGELRRMRPEDQFSAIAAKIREIQDPAARTKLAMDVMGKGALEVMPLLVSEFDQLRDSARQMGLVLDAQTVAQLDDLGDSMDTLKLAGSALLAKVLVPMVPAITAAVNGLLDLAGKVPSVTTVIYRLAEAYLDTGRRIALMHEQMLLALREIPGASRLYTGLDEAIAAAGTRTLDFGLALFALRREMADLGKTTDATRRAVVPLAVGVSGAGASAKATAESIDAMRASLAKVAEAFERAQDAADLRDAKESASEYAGELALVARRFDTIADFATAASQRIANAFPRNWALQLMNPFGKALTDAQTKGLDLLGTLRNISRAFGELAAVAGGSLSTVFRVLGTAATSASLVGESIGAIKSGFSALRGADGITKSLTKGLASMTSGILGAAAAALQLGAALWDALTKSRAEQTMERIGRDLGLTVTESFAQTIEDRAKQLFGGNRQAARIFSLKGMLDAGGGLTADNFGPLVGEFRDLFSMVETGAFTAAQGIQVLDENFRTFADFVTKGGSLAQKELLEIIRLSRDMGLNSEAVNAFVNDQLRTALDGFTAFADARSTVVSDLADARKALDELVKDKAPAAEIEAARKKVTELSQALTALPITAEGALGIGASLAAMFSEGLRQGRPIVDLLREIGPVAEQYAEHFAMAGVTGGQAFEQLRRLAGIASSEISGPAVSAISGLSTALASMHNAGLLNQEMFTGITSQLVSLKAGLEATGVSSGDAMLIMKDGLQTAWELWKDHNYVVDEATKKLLEEAEAAGVVGDEHRTVQEQMLKATLEMRDAVVGLAQVFGVTAVGAVNDFGDAIRNLPDLPSVPDFPDAPVRSPSGAMPDRGMFPDGFTPDLPKHDAGAFVRKDHVAMVHSGEMIGPVSFMSQALEGALAARSEPRVSASAPTEVTINISAMDARSFEDFLRHRDNGAALMTALAETVVNGGRAHDQFFRMTQQVLTTHRDGRGFMRSMRSR